MLINDKKIFKRAAKGIRNCPFNLFFYQTLLENSLSAYSISLNKSKYIIEGYMFINSSSYIENEFIKLIKIGVLRREVDGQGLTSRVRITPIGRKVLENSPDLFNQKITVVKKLIKCFKYQLKTR